MKRIDTSVKSNVNPDIEINVSIIYGDNDEITNQQQDYIKEQRLDDARRYCSALGWKLIIRN